MIYTIFIFFQLFVFAVTDLTQSGRFEPGIIQFASSMRKNIRPLLNNRTIDQYFRPSLKAPLQDTPNKNIINVPPSSGLPGTFLPANAVLRYPTRPEWREYQQQIVSKCICYNTLVCLPTGLGKTHVAAVVIANFARWFPQQKILFLAPTRPLVRQQISALKHMRDQVPPQKILQVNGQLQAFKRKQLYQTYQVIFATPQTIENDLENGRLQGSQVVLLIIDECHRAVGNFSYSKIVRLMNKMDVGFRLIGLSATPGYEHDKIQEVISNLNISKVIYKDENQPEVKKYLHQKIIHEVEISENNIIKQAMAHLEKFAAPSLGLLAKLELMQPWMIRKGLAGASFFLIREKFSQRIDSIQPKMKNMAYSALKIVNFLSRCRKSLNDQGYQTFKLQFFSEIEPSKNTPKDAQSKISYVQQKPEFSKDDQQSQQINLDQIFGYYPQSSITTSKTEAKPFGLPPQFKAKIINSAEYTRLREMFNKGAGKQMHPKLSKLSQILQDFFRQREGKAIVFTQLRISAKQIKEYLQGVQGVRCGLFFGQSKTVGQDTQTGESFCLQLRQRDQLELIQKYKSGQINTLISTSIGQEGLDIGQVDCIVCYDGGHSPIRAIQRRGRTGRKRAGEVYMLLMEGKEIQEYRKGMKKQSKMKDILKTQLSTFLYFAYNSSLFQENTIIPIQCYENVIQESAKKTKIKVSDAKPKAKQTKKSKKAQQKLDQKPTQPQNQQRPEQQLIEVHIKTLGQLLQKYKGDSATQQQQQPNQSQASQQTPQIAKSSQPLQPANKTPLIPSDLIDSSSESDEEITMAEYFKQKKQEQSQSTILQEHNRDSIDSQELLSIIQALRSRPEKTSLPAQN